MYRYRMAACLGSALLLSVAALIAEASGKDNAGHESERGNQASPEAVDTLGDPLPDRALLRLGTTRFRHPSTVVELALSPDEETVVTLGSDELIAWDTKTGKPRWRANSRENGIDVPAASYGIQALAFAPSGTTFYTPGRNDQVTAWDTLTGNCELISLAAAAPNLLARQLGLERPGSFKSIDVSPNGQALAIGGGKGLTVCNADGKQLFTLSNRPKKPIRVDDMNSDRLTFGGEYCLGLFAPDGEMIAVTASEDPTAVRIVDGQTGDERRRISTTKKVVRFAFSPDGRFVAATERDSAVRLYRVEDGQEVWAYQIKLTNDAESYTSAVQFSPDGATIAVGAPIGSDNDIYLLDAATGDVQARLQGHSWKPWALAFTASGETLYSAGWDGPVRRWDVATGRQLPLPQGVRATAVVAAAPDGQSLAYTDDQGAIHQVSSSDAAEIRTLTLEGFKPSDLSYSSDARLLASGGTRGDNVAVVVWQLSDGQLVNRWEWRKGRDPHADVECVRFSPDGKRLAAAVFRQSAAYLWDVSTNRQVARLGHQEVYGLSFSRNGSTLATAGWDRKLRCWSADAGKLQQEFKVDDGDVNLGQDRRMYTVCYSPVDDMLATAHLDGVVCVWTADLELKSAFRIPGRFIFGSIAFSPDGLWLATGSQTGELTLWDPLAGEKVWDIGKHESYVYTVAFGNDAKTLVSGGRDGVCYLWSLVPQDLKADPVLQDLWKQLTAADGIGAYRAMAALDDLSDEEAASFVAQKLSKINAVLDMSLLVQNARAREADRRRRLSQQLMGKDESVISLAGARRAVAVLERLSSPVARDALVALAENESPPELAILANAALHRLEATTKP